MASLIGNVLIPAPILAYCMKDLYGENLPSCYSTVLTNRRLMYYTPQYVKPKYNKLVDSLSSLKI